MSGLAVVLFNSLADLSRCYSHNRIGGRIVIRLPAEYFDPERSFLKKICFSCQSMRQDIFQKTRISLARTKMAAEEKLLQLVPYCNLRRIIGRYPLVD